jgi:divalent metal cation (Fe/Co/Zn/Cd) transporter
VDQTVVDADGLEALVASIDGVHGVRQIRSHQAGSEKLVEVVVTVHGGLSTTASHAIADEIERRVGEQIGGVRVQVHVEPAA